MIKYFYIIKFLMTNDLTELKEFWRVEFMKTEKEFKWWKMINRIAKNQNNYFFWYRLAYFMNRLGSNKQARIAQKINKKLSIKYSIDIPLNASIDIGLTIWHFVGIVITERAIIGKKFQIASNVVIGFINYYHAGSIQIGDNVMIGTNSVILGQNINIGNNVKIGAMSFINENIPDNCTVYTEKNNKIVMKNN
jgi:serine O-acetyltransferase